MSDRRDEDEGLGWAGDDDPTLAPVGVPAREPAVTTPARPTAEPPARPAAEPTAEPAVAPTVESSDPARRSVLDEAEEAEDRAVEKELAEAEAAGAQMSSPALIALGVLGGVYLLFTIGWIVSFSRYEVPLDIDFTVISHRVQQSLAVAAAPLWFVATLLITQHRRRYRFLWLVIGVLVLVPWPFLMGV